MTIGRTGRFVAWMALWFGQVACTAEDRVGAADASHGATPTDVQVVPDVGIVNDALAGDGSPPEGDDGLLTDVGPADDAHVDELDTATHDDIYEVEGPTDGLADTNGEPEPDVVAVDDLSEAPEVEDDIGPEVPEVVEAPDVEAVDVPDVIVTPEDVGPEPDTSACVPDCEGKTCGPNGCGGSCGSCPSVSGGVNVCLAEGAESCLGRCGETGGECACDDLCASFDDCCVDYDAACVAELGAGTCTTVCDSGKQLCNGKCVTAGTTSACGAECAVCPPPTQGPGKATCVAGKCGITCNAGHHRCGDACVANDDAGQCGVDCVACPEPPNGNGTATCELNSCGIACDVGYIPCQEGCCEAQIAFEQIHDSVDVTEDLDLVLGPAKAVHVASYEDLDGAYHFERSAAGVWSGEKLAGKSTSWRVVSLSVHPDTGRPYVAYATDDDGGGGVVAWVDDATGNWKDGGVVKGEFTLDVEERYTMFGLNPSLQRLKIKDTKIQYGALTLQDAGTAQDADVSGKFVAASYAGALAVHRTDVANWLNGAYYVVWQGTGYGRVRVVAEGDSTHVVYEQSGVLRSRTYLGPDIDDWSAVATLLDPKPSLNAAILSDGGWDAAAAPDGQVVLCYYDSGSGSGQVWVKRGAAPPVLVGAGGWECALDVDASGDVHLAYLGPAPEGQPGYTGTVQYAFIPGVLLVGP